MYICIYNMCICIYVFIICIYVLYIRMYIWYETSSWNQHDTRKPFEELKCKSLKPLESNCRNRTTQLRRLGDVRLSALVQPRPCTWSAHKSWALMKVPPGRKSCFATSIPKASKSHKYAFQWQSMQGVRWFCAFLQSHLFWLHLPVIPPVVLPVEHAQLQHCLHIIKDPTKSLRSQRSIKCVQPNHCTFQIWGCNETLLESWAPQARLVAIRLEFVFVRK